MTDGIITEDNLKETSIVETPTLELPPAPEEEVEHFKCPKCGHVSGTKNGFDWHRRNKHDNEKFRAIVTNEPVTNPKMGGKKRKKRKIKQDKNPPSKIKGRYVDVNVVLRIPIVLGEVEIV